MPGWCSAAACRASAAKRARKVGSSAYSCLSTLTATSRPSTVSRARQTSPMPPVAIRLDALVAVGARRCPVVVAHLPITASMTALAIGAARPLPEIWSRATPASCDQHGDGDRGVVGRRERDEPGVRRTVGRALRGAGLAGDLDARDLRGRAGAVVDDADHHLGQVARRGGAHRGLVGHRLGVGRADGLELGRLDLVDEVGLHHRAVVGDPGGDHRHLQRGGGHVELADRRQRGLRLVGVLGEAADRLAGQRSSRSWKVRVPKPNFSACVAQRVVAELEADRAEGDVAGDLERLGQGDLVAAAAAAVLVDEVLAWSAAGRGVAPPGTLVSGVYLPDVERGRRGDQLERRARRQGLLDRAVVAAGSSLSFSQPLLGLADRGEVVGGQPVGVVRRAGDHRQDLAGARLDRDDGALDVVAERLQPVVRRLLRVGVDGQRDAAALGRLVVDEVDDPVDEQRGVAAGEDRVLASTRRRRGPSRGRSSR